MAEQQPHDPESFTKREAVFLIVVFSLSHPLQALRELFRVIFRAVRGALGRVVGFVLWPFFRPAIRLVSRNRSRHPSFEDYLHRSDGE